MAAAGNNTGKILVIDDEWNIRDILSSILVSEGFDVDTAEDGEVGIAKMESKLYDLVITARDDPERLEAFVTALVPVYFGRVASAVIENRELSTERAEESVERQAREFERLKPYLLNRWSAS
jgi:DNA-binding NtrC family response regulator